MNPDVEVHLRGPASPTLNLERRLSRYLSPPLFPVRLRDLPNAYVHDLDPGRLTIGSVTIHADYVVHPGLTFGYRIEAGGATISYLPDHEPAFGSREFPAAPEWTSGFSLVEGADVSIHDAQYTDAEMHRGRGGGTAHSAMLRSWHHWKEWGRWSVPPRPRPRRCHARCCRIRDPRLGSSLRVPPRQDGDNA